ncbi:hypothetical protein LCGC14_1111340 [marine sediment metagenome]|uniref:Uncharacterized protein n=1 Tax=marine sediment metagenome TaxID=412755 RepID=A0A0F9QCR2_9ZZZZ
MKYRVMAFDGTITDFDKESEAHTLYIEKKKLVEKAEVKGDIVPSCSRHICYHDEAPPGGTPPRPCEPIEKFTKQVRSI